VQNIFRPERCTRHRSNRREIDIVAPVAVDPPRTAT